MSVKNESSQGISLSIASVRECGVIVMGFSKKVIFVHYNKPQEALVVDDGQIVRDVAVSQVSENGPFCVVTGGDGKRINVYNTSTSNTSPVFSFGPHTKRITHVAIDSNATILFADKFGEVYRLELSRDSFYESSASNSAVKPIFLLQHFSVITNLFLLSSVFDSTTGTQKQWLFTCDRDRHTRVSSYPDTYRIEQFLWTNSPQSVVTCITEIPMEKEHYTYFLIGCHDGKVHLWSAEHCASAVSQNPFVRVDSYFDPSGERGPVVGIVHAARGAFVAHAASQEVTFLPFREGEVGFALEGIVRVALGSFPAAMAPLSADTVLLLEYSGRLMVLRPTNGKVQIEEDSHVALRAAVEDVMNRTVEGGTMLSAMDPFAHWSHDAVDPRSRHRSRKEMEISENESDEDDLDTTAKNNNNDNNNNSSSSSNRDNERECESKKHRRELSDEPTAL